MPESLFDRVAALAEVLGLGRASDVTGVMPLTGGVASDIARVDVAGRSYCVKFALPKLRVAAEWYAPVHRNQAEYAWLGVAGGIVPGAAPRLHGCSAALHGFAMEEISGPGVTLWKTTMLSGAPERDEAARVGDVLGRIHAAGSLPGFDRGPFGNAADFHAIRTEPYLLHTAQQHPALATRLRDLAAQLQASAITLVHGDVSPKNILFRQGDPVFLDAECATMGDPAFDLSFCMNHLVLKAVHQPSLRADRLRAVSDLWRAHRTHVTWEAPEALEARVAALVPALMLARIDGKSPVEYLSTEDRAKTRALAIPMISRPFERLGEVLDWLQQGMEK